MSVIRAVCPACATALELAPDDVRGTVAVCPHCRRSIVVTTAGDQSVTRLATAADTSALSPDDLSALRRARQVAR